MASFLQSLRRFFAQPQVREFLLWCLPALLVGFAIRAVLMAQLPYAVYHDDSGDLLTTANSWLNEKHRFEIHGKKTFLVPLICFAFALLHLPILLGMPILQHLLGLVFILMVGLLCRLWFAHWRWLIIPITLLMAIDPALLWYEHLVMAETAYVFTLTLVAVAGTLYALRQSRARFAFLCVSLVLLAGSRPEGKLLFGFAFLLLALLHWRAWRVTWIRFVVLLVVAVATHFATQTHQAGLLLYTSVVRLTPPNLKAAPGFEPYIAPVQTDLQQRWDERPSFPRVADRRSIALAVEEYMKAQNPGKGPGHEDVDALCIKIAKETCVRNFFYLPVYFYEKFRFTTNEPTYGFLDNRWVFERQSDAFLGKPRIANGLGERITGSDLGGKKATKEVRAAAYEEFLQQHYREIPWFNKLANKWNNAVLAIRLPDEIRVADGKRVLIRRLPVLYLLGAAGLLLIMLRRGILQPFHLAWGLTLLGLFYVIILTANIRGRFRFGLEPFWYLYLGLIADSLAYWCLWKRRQPAAPAVPEAAESPSVIRAA